MTEFWLKIRAIRGARKRKKLLGRPKEFGKYQYVKHLYDNKGISIDKACVQAGISKASFYRIENNK